MISPQIAEETIVPGLRDRKKAMRHDEILSHAKQLFTERGIDATTMGDIAEAANVSPPTVFNYFGNKDGIIIALISEGSRKAIAQDVALTTRTDDDFRAILLHSLTSISTGTLGIASKRVWRYSEAAAIRHPNTELAQEYIVVEQDLKRALKNFIGQYDLSLRAGGDVDPDYIADLIYTLWNAEFFALIKDEKMDIPTHAERLSAAIYPLITLLFDDAFLASPVLKSTKG